MYFLEKGKRVQYPCVGVEAISRKIDEGTLTKMDDVVYALSKIGVMGIVSDTDDIDSEFEWYIEPSEYDKETRALFCKSCLKYVGKDNMHLQCDVCGAGLCDECYENDVDSDVTQDAFSGEEDVLDEDIAYLKVIYGHWDLMCYDCEGKLKAEALAFRKANEGVTLILNGKIEEHNIEDKVDFIQKIVLTVQEKGYVDMIDLYKSLSDIHVELLDNKDLEEGARYYAQSFYYNENDIFKYGEDHYLMELEYDNFLFQSVVSEVEKERLIEDYVWVAYEDEDCEKELSGFEEFDESLFRKITVVEANVLKSYLKCGYGNFKIFSKEDCHYEDYCEVDDEEDE